MFWNNADTAKPEGSAGQVPNFYKTVRRILYRYAGASILPTDEFLKRKQSVRFATQSGPMPLCMITSELPASTVPPVSMEYAPKGY
ncbi:uncharacterized protein YigE (DUF2233 family) [Rhizobium redzepovicii]